MSARHAILATLLIVAPAIAVLPITAFDPGGQVALKAALLVLAAGVQVATRDEVRASGPELWLAAFAIEAFAATIAIGKASAR